jgi:O-methyltransferase involved in polyketide biosynthesis
VDAPPAPNTGRILDAWLGGKHHFPADAGAAQAFKGLYEPFPKVFKLLRDFIGRASRHAADQGIDQFLVLGAGIPTQGNVHEAVPGARVLYTDLDPVNVALGKKILEGTRAGYDACDATNIHGTLDKVNVERVLGPIHRLCIVVVGVHAFMTDEQIERSLAQLHQWAPAGSMLIADFDGEGLATVPQALAILDGAGSKLFMRRPSTISALLGPWQPSPEGVVAVDAWRNPTDSRHSPVFMYGVVARKL